MRSYRVQLSPVVIQQIREQVFYIARVSIDRALQWEDRLQAAVQSLSTTHGHNVDDAMTRHAGIEVRKLVFEGTYIIHYHVNDCERLVEVLNFRHGARLPGRE